MKLTLESDYALRIILVLAKHNKTTEAKVISRDAAVPHPYTLKILRKLMEGNLVGSDRGKRGGYNLLKNPKELTVLEILSITEGEMCLARCMESDYICSRMGQNKENCAFHRFFGGISKQLSEALKSKTISDILSESQK